MRRSRLYIRALSMHSAARAASWPASSTSVRRNFGLLAARAKITHPTTSPRAISGTARNDANRAAIAWWSGSGLFLSCALLEIVGAAVGTAVGAGPALAGPGGMTGLLATPLADLTLLAIALGAVSANVLNIYSGALSFTAIGIKLPLALRRAIVALGFGAIGFFLAWSGLHNAASRYENFLLIIAYWIAPWLAVYFCDQLLRRDPHEALLFDTRRTNWAGPVAMLVGMGISIWLFSNQTEYIGVVPSHVGAVGDLTFEVGFLITAVVYLGWHLVAGTGRENTLAG